MSTASVRALGSIAKWQLSVMLDGQTIDGSGGFRRRDRGAIEIRELTATSAFEYGQPAVSAPFERATANRTGDGL
jgi:hypothetical protein